jgi:hypothetical protein
MIAKNKRADMPCQLTALDVNRFKKEKKKRKKEANVTGSESENLLQNKNFCNQLAPNSTQRQFQFLSTDTLHSHIHISLSL